MSASPVPTRSLALLAPGLIVEYPELVGVGIERHWRFYPELGAVQIIMDSRGNGQLLDFLRSAIEPRRLEALRAAWVCPDQSLERQLFNLIHAGPLLKVLSENA